MGFLLKDTPSSGDRGIRSCKEILDGSLLLFYYIATMHVCEFWLKNDACMNLGKEEKIVPFLLTFAG